MATNYNNLITGLLEVESDTDYLRTIFESITYSAEDNKLRLYATHRFDKSLWLYFKSIGMVHAPKQELFVFSHRIVREDLCLFLLPVGEEITREGTTLAERAEQRAERFDGYRAKRTAEANYYHESANRYSERFAMGQPILVGHHSEKSARRDQKRMDSAMNKSIDQTSKADYWAYRANGVERHANQKNSPRTRANRIKKLFAELRSIQREIDKNYRGLEKWQTMADMQDKEKQAKFIEILAGSWEYSYQGAYDDMQNDNVSILDVMNKALNMFKRLTSSNHNHRVVAHVLNRIGYEISMQGEVSRFDGDITATVLQTFCRTHGADKPKAKKDGDNWIVTCESLMPVHLSDEKTLSLSSAEWVDLMHKVGYSVEAKKIIKTAKAQAPLLNLDVNTITTISRGYNPSPEILEVVKMTKEEYKNIRKESKGTKLSACGMFRIRVAWISASNGGFLSGGWKPIFLTNQKAHQAPEDTNSINNELIKKEVA